MVEAAGIEPVLRVNTNPMMAHDFGFYCLKNFELPRRFDSPGVLTSLGDILETVELQPFPYYFKSTILRVLTNPSARSR